MMRAVEPIQRVTAVIERQKDGYVALCPELDIASHLDTIEGLVQTFRGSAPSYLTKSGEAFQV